jgi:hypothetical protein
MNACVQHGEAFLEMLRHETMALAMCSCVHACKRDICHMRWMHGCLIASKKATATKMVFTKRATIERAWNFGERQRGRQFLRVHINMITLERDLKELFFI